MKNSVANNLINALHSYGGVDYVFCVPGNPLGAPLDAIAKHPEMHLINSADEMGVAHATHAYAQSKGLGVAMVSAGVGINTGGSLLSYLSQVHPAPTLLLVGQEPEEKRGKPETFQTIDTQKALSQYSKAVLTVKKDDDITEIVKKAIQLANDGTPGNVTIELPQDIMALEANPSIPNEAFSFQSKALNDEGKRDLKSFVHQVNLGKKPLLLVGDYYAIERLHKPGITDILKRVANKMSAGVATTQTQSDQFSNSHQNFVGVMGAKRIPEYTEILHEFDLPILFGAPPDDNLAFLKKRGEDTYWKERPFVLVHPDKTVLDYYKNKFPNMVPVESGMEAALTQLNDARFKYNPLRSEIVKKQHAKALDAMKHSQLGNVVDLSAITASVAKACEGENVKHVIDAGDAALTVGYALPHETQGTRFAMSHGCVGFATGAAVGVAAAQKHNNPIVIAHTGDSGFKYTGFELETAKLYQLPIIVMVYNDQGYAAIERNMNMKGYAETAKQVTRLSKSNYAKVAEGMGVEGISVDGAKCPAEVGDALKKAIENAKLGKSTVIDVDIANLGKTLSR